MDVFVVAVTETGLWGRDQDHIKGNIPPVPVVSATDDAGHPDFFGEDKTTVTLDLRNSPKIGVDRIKSVPISSMRS